MITSPADTLVCDTTQLAVWQSDPAYDYGRELMAPDINVFEWFNRWFGKILQKYLAVILLRNTRSLF